MANNPYVNKVVKADGTTIIDISDTTATAADVLNSKYFYTASGQKVQGTGVAGSVTQDQDGFIVLPPDGSGGGSNSWSWMGKNPTKVASCLNEKVYLKDTDFATWTPSTTATELIPQATLTAQSVDFNSYDYVLLYKFHTHFDYVTEGNNRITDFYTECGYVAFAYASSLSEITTDTIGYTVTTFSITMSRGLFYINSSGNNGYTTSYALGFYPTDYPIPSTSNAGSITPKTSAINARCSNTYFSTASAEAVNQNTSYYEQTVDLWRVDRGTTPRGALYADIRDMWLNGF